MVGTPEATQAEKTEISIGGYNLQERINDVSTSILTALKDHLPAVRLNADLKSREIHTVDLPNGNKLSMRITQGKPYTKKPYTIECVMTPYKKTGKRTLTEFYVTFQQGDLHLEVLEIATKSSSYILSEQRRSFPEKFSSFERMGREIAMQLHSPAFENREKNRQFALKKVLEFINDDNFAYDVKTTVDKARMLILHGGLFYKVCVALALNLTDITRFFSVDEQNEIAMSTITDESSDHQLEAIVPGLRTVVDEVFFKNRSNVLQMLVQLYEKKDTDKGDEDTEQTISNHVTTAMLRGKYTDIQWLARLTNIGIRTALLTPVEYAGTFKPTSTTPNEVTPANPRANLLERLIVLPPQNVLNSFNTSGENLYGKYLDALESEGVRLEDLKEVVRRDLDTKGDTESHLFYVYLRSLVAN